MPLNPERFRLQEARLSAATAGLPQLRERPSHNCGKNSTLIEGVPSTGEWITWRTDYQIVNEFLSQALATAGAQGSGGGAQTGRNDDGSTVTGFLSFQEQRGFVLFLFP